MAYLQLRFHVQRARADELSGVLEALGALSVTWENAGEDAYYEVAYPREPDWQRVHVTGLFDDSCKPDALMRQVSERMGAALVPEVRVLEEQDWERAWLTRFEPRKCRGDLWVCPSWADPPDPDAVSIIIDPGLAFGTGDHPTTALCLDWISEHDVSGMTVVDYGCGSGILAIACLLKGAARATGVDVDPRALSASELNAARNGVQERYKACYPAELPAGQNMDLVIANILSSVLVQHADELTSVTRPGGTLLLSGILEDHEDQVRAAFEPAFQLETETRDGWCMLVGRRAGGGAATGRAAGQTA